MFVEVESHEMVDVEDNKSSKHIYPDAESEHEQNQNVWDAKKSVDSVV